MSLFAACCSEIRSGKQQQHQRDEDILDTSNGENIRVMLETTTVTKVDVPRALFGMNAQFFSGQIDYAHPKLPGISVDELGCSVIRWPGGTNANAYNVFEEKLDDEKMTGVDGKEIDVEECAQKRKYKATNENIARSKTSGKYKVKDFGIFYERCKGRMRVSLVLNVCTRDETHTRAVCERLKQENVDVAFCEIGNEVYFPAYAPYIDTVEEYAERCDKHSKMVKFFYPKCKIGVVASSAFWSNESFLDDDNAVKNNKNKGAEGAGRKATWNAKLAKILARKSETFSYDAVIIHMYGSPGRHGSQFFPTELEFYAHSLSHLELQFAKTMQNLVDTFGNDKKVWVTEFGVGGFDSQEIRKHPFKKSYLAALLVMEFLRRLSAFECVEMANMHSLNQMIDLEKRKGNAKSGEYHDVGIKRTVFSHALAFFKDLSETSSSTCALKRSELSIIGASRKTISSGKYAPCTHNHTHATLFESDKSDVILIMNLFDTEQKIRDLKKPTSTETFSAGKDGVHGDSAKIIKREIKDEERVSIEQSFVVAPFSAVKLYYAPGTFAYHSQ